MNKDAIIAQLRQDIEDYKACHRHECDKIHKSYGRILGMIQDHARDVKDAASLTPPRTHIIDDRCDIIVKMIKAKFAERT